MIYHIYTKDRETDSGRWVYRDATGYPDDYLKTLLGNGYFKKEVKIVPSKHTK